MDDSNGLVELCGLLLAPSTGKTYDQVILINNGGSLGDVTKPLDQFTDPLELQTFFGCNVTSPIVLTGKFIHRFSGTSTAIVVVNISSLCAIEPIPAMGVYCISKAARDMSLRIYGKERPDVLCLNYAPGPLDTAMTETLATKAFDEKTRSMFQKMKEEKTYVKMEDSAKKLIGLLQKGGIQSGSHIDFFDPDT
jgi:sepiapterin reductase